LQRKFLRRLPEWSRTRIFQVRSADNAVRPTLCIDLATLEAWLRATMAEPRAHWDRATLRKLKLYLAEASSTARAHFPELMASTPFAEGWDRKAAPVRPGRAPQALPVVLPSPEPCPPKGEILPLREVPFHGNALIGGVADGDGWLPFKRTCKGFGIGYDAQAQWLRRESGWATARKFLVVGASGKLRLTTCINLETFTGWLMQLNANDIRHAAVRDNLLIYKREASRVLRAAFFGSPQGQPAVGSSVMDSVMADSVELTMKGQLELFAKNRQLEAAQPADHQELTVLKAAQAEIRQVVAEFKAAWDIKAENEARFCRNAAVWPSGPHGRPRLPADGPFMTISGT
jgi:hypothetical protein